MGLGRVVRNLALIGILGGCAIGQDSREIQRAQRIAQVQRDFLRIQAAQTDVPKALENARIAAKRYAKEYSDFTPQKNTILAMSVEDAWFTYLRERDLVRNVYPELFVEELVLKVKPENPGLGDYNFFAGEILHRKTVKTRRGNITELIIDTSKGIDPTVELRSNGVVVDYGFREENTFFYFMGPHRDEVEAIFQDFQMYEKAHDDMRVVYENWRSTLESAGPISTFHTLTDEDVASSWKEEWIARKLYGAGIYQALKESYEEWKSGKDKQEAVDKAAKLFIHWTRIYEAEKMFAEEYSVGNHARVFHRCLSHPDVKEGGPLSHLTRAMLFKLSLDGSEETRKAATLAIDSILANTTSSVVTPADIMYQEMDKVVQKAQLSYVE